MSKYSHAPMGWNSWDCYGAAVDEATVKQNADFMAQNLKEFGWEYVVVDIQWSCPVADTNEYHPFTELCMDEYSRLIPAPNRFPSAKDGAGFKPLGDYIHSLGLKFGIHIMRGIPRQAVHQNTKVLGTDHTAREIAKTASICAWNTDMYGVDPAKEGAKEYYESLFKLYASWGVDFIKCDDICRELPHEEEELRILSDALKNCGREMILSLSPGPALLEKAEFYKEVSNMWRITDDFWDQWELLYAMFERAEKWSIHTGADHWPDADMLPIGAIRQVYDPANRTKFTKDEQITMMTLWCIMRAPLMIGGELTKMDEFDMSLLTNKRLLEMFVNARHSHQCFRKDINGIEHIGWIAVGTKGETYVAIFNTGDENSDVSVSFDDFELDGEYEAVEVWSGEKQKLSGKICVNIPSHGAVAYKLN